MFRHLLLITILFMVSSYSCAMELDGLPQAGKRHRYTRLVPFLFPISDSKEVVGGMYQEEDVERLVVHCRRNYPGKEKLTLYLQDRSGRFVRRKIDL